MASATFAPEPFQKEPLSSGLLSKFSRSPSRKHKQRPSSESIEAIVPVPTSKPTRSRPRPGPHRTTTAPDGPTSLNAIKELPPPPSNVKAHTPVEENMEHAGFALAGAVRQPVFKTVKKTDDVPEVPSLNGAQFAHSAAWSIPPPQAGQQSNPNTLFQHMHDLSSKRIATLEYMRKAHEGRIFWFNTVQFSKADVSKLPSYGPARLSRRATNYLLLGMSIPTVLDVHPPPHPQNTSAMNLAIAQDYLRSLNSLLAEFETFQSLHPTDGSSTSSLSRARLPQMFKRSNTRPRKSSGTPVTEIGMPLQQSMSAPAMPEHPPSSSHGQQPSLDATFNNASSSSSSTPGGHQSAPSVPSVSFPTLSSFPPPAAFDAPNSSLLPNEGPYTHLLTPPLPFTPDFYTVFSTLCDVLIDAYQRLLQLLGSPNVCTPVLSETFTKVDARIRKVMVGGIIREFENSCRDNAKKELMGVQKVVLGGLMGN